ncbi:amino acid synthesis family protein [Xanthobacteraceae bacterium A53D]
MQLTIRRTCVIIRDKNEEAGLVSPVPQRKVAVAAIVKNPYLDGYVEDLSELVAASVPLGATMAEMIREALGGRGVQAYGKGGLVGLSGEQEHANALLTTAFATPFRDMIGGGEAWISSMTKVAAPGALIDVPMNHKDDVYVRSHYDGMSLVLPDGPMPDEIAVIFCVASIGRLNARVGGLTHAEVEARINAAKA